jgi:protein brassinosteroid insensitive 1
VDFAGSVAMGMLFSLFCIFGLIIAAIETRKRRKKKDAASFFFFFLDLKI